MKRVPVDCLQAGCVFSEPVYFDDQNIFVGAKEPVEQSEIDKIKSWNIADVFTNGTLLSGTLLRPTAPVKAMQQAAGGAVKKPIPIANLTLEAARSAKQEAVLHNRISSLIRDTDTFFSRIENRGFVDPILFHTVAAELASIVQAAPKIAIGFVLNGNISGFETARNAICTGILSILIFNELAGPNVRNQDLAVSAILHDVGMLRLPHAVREKKGMLADLERALIEAHVAYGYQIVKQELRCSEAAAVNVLQHHERIDGRGYSQGLQASQIDIGAKVISVADAFDAMVSEKPYRNSMTGYEAMKNLMSDNSRRFDPNVLGAFVKIMGIYPVGQEVLLNNGAEARVVEARQGASLRPLVVITREKDGTVPAVPRSLDLLNQPNLYIVRAIHKGKS